MFSVQFHLDADRLKQYAQNRVQNLVKSLQDRQDKTFRLPVDDETYDIRYEIDPQGQVQLFVRSPETGDRDLIVPDLNLNIGAMLLPESMALDEAGDGFNPDVEYVPYKVLGSNSLSEAVLRRIRAKILKIGFIKLVTK